MIVSDNHTECCLRLSISRFSLGLVVAVAAILWINPLLTGTGPVQRCGCSEQSPWRCCSGKRFSPYREVIYETILHHQGGAVRQHISRYSTEKGLFEKRSYSDLHGKNGFIDPAQCFRRFGFKVKLRAS
ncbi:hypothetical protein [Rosenbergiella epipactidis]|uniref:hypothetical protein n=1 Tax=Rosenbergiella epipactidis TaxID=1544694 RepID=UPI001F4EA7F9|nr:hypothetical protein [Rosenbergiella epipactidis]